MEKEYLSVKEIADKLGVSADTVQGLIRRKELVAYKVGNTYRIKKEDFDKFMEERRTDKKDEEKP
jgi:excisionase family DNA binding protein